MPTTSPGFIARRGETLEFGVTGPEANTGSLLGLTPGVGVDEGFAWTIDVSGRLVLDFEDYGLTSFPFRDFIRASDAEKQILADAEIDWIQEDREIISYTYTRVTDGTLVDVALREIRTIITYPPITLPDGSELVIAGQPFVEIETDEQTLRSSLDIEPIPFVATCPGSNNNVCVEGNWGGQFHFSPGPDFFGNPYPATAWGDIAAFNADGTVASATGRNLSGSWTIDPDGALVIDYDDGWTQKMQVLDRLGIEYGIISDYSNGSERFASYTIYVKSDGTEFNAGLIENGAGKFWNGDLNSWQPEAFDENGVRNLDFRFGWQFDTGANTGRNRWGVDFLGCDKGLYTTDMTWDVQPDGRLLIDRFANFAAGVFIRTWHPVALTTSGGERVLYVMEVEDRLRVDGQPGFGIRIPPRLNIQREIDEFTDWGCSASR